MLFLIELLHALCPYAEDYAQFFARYAHSQLFSIDHLQRHDTIMHSFH